MVVATSELLGVGLYTPEEAALYARVFPRMLCRWLYGGSGGERVIAPQIGMHQEQRVVTFVDFVQAMAVRAVTLARQVSLQRIRQAIDNAQHKYGISHPFARKHTTYLLGNEIVIHLGDEEYVQASGKSADQRLLKVVEIYLQDLTFNDEGVATVYRAFRWGEFEITMNPKLRFGEPLLPSCGYSAHALWEAYQSEGSFDTAAQAYGVNPAEVEAACRYIDHISSVPPSREPKAETPV